ncbi:MAG: type II toxin-antitoxin system RelE/ParE family toxin [Planctomycetes bacterium]|nr:type II toxin-antitoxin system RelE/ParE family toxin [Planctomycetota bacterium]
MASISFTESSLEDLGFFSKKEQSSILKKVEEQLIDEPAKQTRNRKPLRPNSLASWELRIKDFRVFFDIEDDAKSVKVKAFGRKEHEKLFVRGKEYKL